MATLEDVARLAGVSPSTVSRALARPEMVAGRTRERVTAAVEELGYLHNPSARALATGRSGLIGLSVPTLANPFFAPIISGAQAAAEAAGNELVIVVSEGRPAREQALLTRLRERVDGIVAVAPRAPSRQISEQARTTPMVTVNREVRGVSSVVIDAPTGLADLGRYLAGLGHRRVAYVGGPRGSWTDRRRREALAAALAPAGGRLVTLGPADPTFAAGSNIAGDVGASGVSAVVAYNSVLAVGLLHRLPALGIRVPEDLSFASADDLTAVGLAVPHITALHVPAAEVGRQAVEILLNDITFHTDHGLSAGRRTVDNRMVPVALVEGTSTRPVGDRG